MNYMKFENPLLEKLVMLFSTLYNCPKYGSKSISVIVINKCREKLSRKS